MTFHIDEVYPLLEKEVTGYKDVPIVDLIAVQTRDPFKVLVATILSARTKDEITAKASARLFKKASDPESLALLSEEAIAKLIYPVGFYKNKARFLRELPAALEALGGYIPDTIDDLVKLPGVGRKTANLVVAVAFNKPAICVDTHVHRIMNIWGYVETKTPLETEMALRQKLPEKYWIRINSILVAFGQAVCKPVRPHCDRCIIQELCPQIGVVPRKLPGEKKYRKINTLKKIISWNVNGLRAVEKKGFVDIVYELDADIIGLQEIKALPDQLPESVRNIAGYDAYWFPAKRKGYAGVCIYTRIKPLNVIYGMDIEEYDREGRVLTLEFNDFYLVNTYFPNAQHGLGRLDYKLDFNRDIHNFVDRLAEKKTVVICGDFNVAHKPIDLANPKQNEENPGYSLPERQWMETFTGAGYIDTFRKFNQEPEQYTWWSYRFNARGRNIGWRIDYFCIDPASEKRIKGAAILDHILGSDHCPVSLDFE
ncbi:MAG: exodeoxyribonuclease III [Deltaproteobacteria bacterium]|nr:MAG: exodeoxyribonuclease III [Deltaproteobacteria bacterium]